MVTKVVNCKKEPYDVLIDRRTIYGNPFIIGRDGTREEVVEKYRKWVPTQEKIMNSLYKLYNKRLGCHCKPKACHGDVLVELINDLRLEDKYG